MSRIETRTTLTVTVSSIEEGSAASNAAGNAQHGVMPAPIEIGTDIAFAIAALVTESAHAQRKNAKASEDAAEAATRAAEDSAVRRMHDKADSIANAAVTTGAMMVVGGTMSFGGSIAATEGSSSPTSVAALQSAGKLMTDCAGSVEGFAKAAQGHMDADIKEDESTQRREQRTAQSAREDLRAIRELLEKVTAFVRDVSRTRADTLLTAARGR